MTLKELISSISKDIEILKSYTEKSFFGVDIDYVEFKIGNHYYLVSELEYCVLTEQTSDRSKDISGPKTFSRRGLKEYIKKLLILEN